jgi:hypothetical protein
MGYFLMTINRISEVTVYLIGMLAFSCCHSLMDVNEIYAEPYLNITIEFENEWCSNICIHQVVYNRPPVINTPHV